MSGNFDLRGRTAVVTGAGSGIGAAISASLARRGCHLALADIDPVGLAGTVETLATTGVRISRHHLDVADEAAIAAFPAVVTEAHGGVHLLFNNAGVAVGGEFEEVSVRDFEWLININFWGVVRMTRAFLPLLRTQPEARIVNLSSLFGLIAPAGQTAYSASKFAVRGFSEALRHELDGSSVGITVVHPGGIKTSIARNARVPDGRDAVEVEERRKSFESQLTMPPSRAGEIIVRGTERRKPRVLVGADAKVLAAFERLMPIWYWGLTRRLMAQ